jgi:hypothetical protein
MAGGKRLTFFVNAPTRKSRQPTAKSYSPLAVVIHVFVRSVTLPEDELSFWNDPQNAFDPIRECCGLCLRSRPLEELKLRAR